MLLSSFVKATHDLLQIDVKNEVFCKAVWATASKRASKWISLSEAKQMKGQVGGLSAHKRPILTIKPDYILKPLQYDHRGLREMSFYEAVQLASTKNPTAAQYANFLRGARDEKSTNTWIDTFAMTLSMMFKDHIVVDSEEALKQTWTRLRKELEAIQRIAKYTPKYYGVVGQRSSTLPSPIEIPLDAHLLLHDLTSTFKRPCAMDLKIGQTTYEPDAPSEKRSREYNKYPQQATFGFRIVGMRMFDPKSAEADADGFVHIGKAYGRSLVTYQEIKAAMERFFSANHFAEPSDGDDISTCLREKTVSQLAIQLRSLRRVFEQNEARLRFYASSLLIVFEGECEVDEKSGASIDSGQVTFKMIDFGRVRRIGFLDNVDSINQGYMFGLKEFHKCLTNFLSKKT